MPRQDLHDVFKADAMANGAPHGVFAFGAVAAGALALGCLTGAAQAAGDPAKGKTAFVRQCAICHTSEKGGDNRFGPNLFGIVGRTAGTMPGFQYTNAFKNRAKWEWTEDAIGSWMMFPSTMVPGTAMGVFQGIAEMDRDDLVAYLATLK
jgi:cytochrome c